MTPLLVVLVLLLCGGVGILIIRGSGARQRSRDTRSARRVAERSRNETPAQELIDQMSQAVVVLNRALVPMMANHAAHSLLNLEASLPPHLTNEELGSIARRALTERKPIVAELMLWPMRRDVRIRAAPLDDGDAVILILQDVTEELSAQKLRKQFVVNASHELKTPVAGIQSLAEALLQALDDDPDTVRHFGERIVTETNRLNRLVQDLLDLSRVEDPSLISMTEVDLESLARTQVHEHRDAAANHGVDLEMMPGGPVYVRGDDRQLGLMIANLLDNAIRYTEGGGRVVVSVAEEEDEALLQVTDTGVGIPLRDQARVFERFFRIDEDRSRAGGGTGLGLSIVKHVAESHGGRVFLRSELGEGSEFTVRLPRGNGIAPEGDRRPNAQR